MDITGTLKVKFDAVQVSEKFKKRDFVIETPDQYPQKILIQLTQTKTDLLDKFKEGDEIKAYINLRGREWKSPEGKVSYFNTIEAWRLEGVQSQGGEQVEEQQSEAPQEDDSLPF